MALRVLALRVLALRVLALVLALVRLNYSTEGGCERVVTEAPRGRGSAWAVLSGPCLIVV